MINLKIAPALDATSKDHCHNVFILWLTNPIAMNLSSQIAKQMREVHFGGNWTSVNLKDTLAEVTWQQASAKVQSLNTIAALTYHINYYVDAILKVLRNEPLTASDKFSFDVPPINSQPDWQRLIDKTFADAETCAALIEQLPETRLWEDFTDKKYGNYYRNFHGCIEHIHYHLGQMVVIKKMLSNDAVESKMQ